jgi:hypothetical protein
MQQIPILLQQGSKMVHLLQHFEHNTIYAKDFPFICGKT